MGGQGALSKTPFSLILTFHSSLWDYADAHEIMRSPVTFLNLFNGVVKTELKECWINTSKASPACAFVREVVDRVDKFGG
ncbi:hypothetical protein ACFL03_15905 [Thermodesulfobacteriota bacterium]